MHFKCLSLVVASLLVSFSFIQNDILKINVLINLSCPAGDDVCDGSPI
jgi:hypothetical protein